MTEFSFWGWFPLWRINLAKKRTSIIIQSPSCPKKRLPCNTKCMFLIQWAWTNNYTGVVGVPKISENEKVLCALSHRYTVYIGPMYFFEDKVWLYNSCTASKSEHKRQEIMTNQISRFQISTALCSEDNKQTDKECLFAVLVTLVETIYQMHKYKFQAF